MKFPFVLLVLPMCAGGPPAAGKAETFTLVRNGKPTATIVLAEKPARSAEFAAAELRHHVLLMTGAALPVIQEPQSVGGPRILLGESQATRKLGLRGRQFAEQEYLIRFFPGTLVLLGKDALSGNTRGDPSLPRWIPGRFGKALRFDGKDDGLTVSDCGFNDEVGSLECWVRFSEAVQEREGTLLRLDGAGPWTYHILRRVAHTNRVGYYTYDGKRVRGVRSKDLPPGWHHVLATHDAAAGVAELYVDGVKQGATDYEKTTCRASTLALGGLPHEGGFANVLHGDLDEIRVSRVVRRPAVDGSGGPYSRDADTTWLAPLDEGHGRPRLGRSELGSIPLPGFFAPNGTLYAVYDFLERFCGVRWYAPGELGTVAPRVGTLSVSGSEVRRKPAMRYRWITPTRMFLPTPADPLPMREVNLWKLRMRLGGEAFWTCHSFGGYFQRFFKTHPEFFAKGYSGKPPQMCYTEPGLIRQVVQDAEDYFAGKGSQPGATNRGPYFGIVPLDNSNYCKCPRCQARMDPSDAGNRQFSRGLASNYIWSFVNEVAREVRRTHPDKWISALAYARYAYYPTKVDLEPNIAVQMCLHTRNWWAPFLAKNDQRIFREWVDRSAGKRPLYLWLYYNFPAWLTPRRHFNVFPGFFVHTVIRQMAMYHRAGIKGVFLEHSAEGGQSFLHDQLDMYVTLKLADDPTLPGRGLVDEFFTKYYGRAAASMKALYTAIEATYMDPKNYPPEVQHENRHFHQTEAMAWNWLGTEARMKRFGAWMEQARRAARTAVEKQRVDQFDRGIWQYMVAGRRAWLRKQTSRRPK